jgi:hypothetical protein
MMVMQPDLYTPKHYNTYEPILRENLYKMIRIEMAVIMGVWIGMISIVWIFFKLNYEAIIDLNPVVRIDYILWLENLEISYYWVWSLIGVVFFTIYLRVLFRRLTQIPIQRSELDPTEKTSKIQIPENGPKISDNSLQDLTTTALRNPWTPFFIGFSTIGGLLIYLNYFPRGETLFPSWELISTDLAIVRFPAQYTGYFMVNIVICFIILNLYLFQFFYSLRQLKDMQKTLKEHRARPNSMNIMQKEDWKPPLPKPWHQMNWDEKKAYKQQVYAIEKQRRLEKEKAELQKWIDEEREKRRIGEHLYKEKEKTVKKQKKIEKVQKKLAKEKEKTRTDYDFR